MGREKRLTLFLPGGYPVKGMPSEFESILEDQLESYAEEQERALESEALAEIEEVRYHRQRTKRPTDQRRQETEWETELEFNGGEA